MIAPHRKLRKVTDLEVNANAKAMNLSTSTKICVWMIVVVISLAKTEIIVWKAVIQVLSILIYKLALKTVLERE